MLQVRELLGRPYQMIECILLPETSFSLQPEIDLRTHVAFPREALLQHRMLVGKRGQDMYMIWHHDKIGQVVTVAVEVMEAFRDDPGQLGSLQDAFSMTCIEMNVPALGEETLE